MITPEHLFQIDYARLCGVCEDPQLDAILDAAAVLRRLLVDDHPLVHQANKGPKLKLLFPVLRGAAKQVDYSDYAMAYIRLEPPQNAPDETEHLTMARFLGVTSFVTDGQSMTVRDFIQYTANVAGGVHKDVAEKAAHVAIEKISSGIAIPQGPVQHTILAVTRVTLAAIEPLYLKLTKGFS